MLLPPLLLCRVTQDLAVAWPCVRKLWGTDCTVESETRRPSFCTPAPVSQVASTPRVPLSSPLLPDSPSSCTVWLRRCINFLWGQHGSAPTGGDSVPGLSQLLVVLGILDLWLHHSHLWLQGHTALSSSVCQISVCFPLISTIVVAFRPTWIIQDNLPILTSLI